MRVLMFFLVRRAACDKRNTRARAAISRKRLAGDFIPMQIAACLCAFATLSSFYITWPLILDAFMGLQACFFSLYLSGSLTPRTVCPRRAAVWCYCTPARKDYNISQSAGGGAGSPISCPRRHALAAAFVILGHFIARPSQCRLLMR